MVFKLAFERNNLKIADLGGKPPQAMTNKEVILNAPCHPKRHPHVILNAVKDLPFCLHEILRSFHSLRMTKEKKSF